MKGLPGNQGLSPHLQFPRDRAGAGNTQFRSSLGCRRRMGDDLKDQGQGI